MPSRSLISQIVDASKLSNRTSDEHSVARRGLPDLTRTPFGKSGPGRTRVKLPNLKCLTSPHVAAWNSGSVGRTGPLCTAPASAAANVADSEARRTRASGVEVASPRIINTAQWDAPVSAANGNSGGELEAQAGAATASLGQPALPAASSNTSQLEARRGQARPFRSA